MPVCWVSWTVPPARVGGGAGPVADGAVPDGASAGGLGRGAAGCGRLWRRGLEACELLFTKLQVRPGLRPMLGGALVVRDRDLFDRLYFVQNATGSVMAPLEAFLCSRGTQTLQLPVRHTCRPAHPVGAAPARAPAGAPAFYPGPKNTPAP